jgi:hypothetical protein
MLRLKEVPRMPVEYEGVVCLGQRPDRVDEEMLRLHFAPHRLLSCELTQEPAILTFATHEAALAAIRAGPGTLGEWMGTLFNERLYGERGWCHHLGSN